MVNRIGKAFTENSQTAYTRYVRDAQGNPDYIENGSNAPQSTLNTLYGVTPELAELNIDFNAYSTICGFSIDFEDQYTALISWTNPSPSTSYFCLGTYTKQPETGNADYRYGFNGKENDDEVKGKGAQYDYGFRIYDARIGKFLSVDPLTSSFPWYTPYQFAGNTPIQAIDLEGAEELKVAKKAFAFYIFATKVMMTSERLISLVSLINKPEKSAKQLVYFTTGKMPNSQTDGYVSDNLKPKALDLINYMEIRPSLTEEEQQLGDFQRIELFAEFKNYGITYNEVAAAKQHEVYVVIIDEDALKYRPTDALKTLAHEIDAHLINNLNGIIKSSIDEHHEYFDIEKGTKELNDYRLDQNYSVPHGKEKPYSRAGRNNKEIENAKTKIKG